MVIDRAKLNKKAKLDDNGQAILEYTLIMAVVIAIVAAFLFHRPPGGKSFRDSITDLHSQVAQIPANLNGAKDFEGMKVIF